MGARMGTDSEVRCCLCREPVNASGWCENCQRWPVNITPIRFCDRGNLVDPDGFCRDCVTYVSSRLEPDNGEWVDTGRIPVLLSRQENQRRWGELVTHLEAKLIAGREGKPAEQQKRELAEWIAEQEEVPF